ELGLGPGRRMYRTGDIVQQNADGSLTYIGRRDTQVKIRGQRVEIGEIESQIVCLLPDARKAIVDVVQPASEAHDSMLMLVAVIEYPEAGTALSSCGALDVYNPAMITEATLKALDKLYIDLMQVLPLYMVPSALLLAPNLPLNLSGKLDRRTIREEMCKMSRELLSSYSRSTTTKQAPKTAMEQRLQSLWAGALSLPPDTVGIKDSFFRLGGDSVVAMKLAAAARAENILLSVADVFRLPRLEDMAAALEEHHEGNSTVEADPLPFSLWPELAKTANTDRERDCLFADIAAQCGIPPDQIEDVYPCSPLQAGLMAITAQHPKAYVIQRVFQLHANLPTERLKAAWNQMVEALPILRTRIVPSIQADALQVVVQEQPVWHHRASLKDYLAMDRANAITYGGELNRTAIIESEDGGSRTFVWTSHHSIYDGWSKSKMIDMFGQLLRGEALPTAPVPVSRFIAYLARQDEKQKVAFWKNHFQGVNWTSYPALPSAQHKVNPRDKLSCQLHISLIPGTATMSTVLRAAWALLVTANTGAEEAVINVVLSGRMAAVDGITDLIAPTITSVPFRVSACREKTTRGFLSDIQQQATEMIPYEHTGLQHIRRVAPSLGPEFDPGHIFLVQPARESESARPMFNIGMDVDDEATSMDAFDAYALNIECTVGGTSEVTVELSFDREIVPVNAAQRLLAQFSHISEQLTRHADVELPLGALKLLPEEDRAQLKQWNSVVPPRSERCLHDLVRENVLDRPSAVALSAWDGEMTYSELDDSSRRLACHLVDRGVGPEVMVGLCMEKSRWAVVAMLAILRAGGSVVPLGVQYPLARIERIVKDTAMSLVLVDPSQQNRLGSTLPATITVDATLHESLPTSGYEACATVTAGNVAWVLYTSGSTGQPQGVVLEHGALATAVLANCRFLSLTTESRTLQFAAFTFDVCITDIFCTLASGGCVCLMSEEDRMNDLAGCFPRTNANYVELTPTALKLLSPDQVPAVTKLALGGEAMEPQLIDKWSSSVQLINSYGPSECAIVCAANIVGGTTDPRNVGKPLAGAFWVVYPGNNNCLCPIGVPGELLVEGPLLARGYLNNPDKTTASFIKDPAFVEELGLSPGRRMYRTGDIVQQNTDGSLSYVGRMDTQVKIRGQRVEIGEIENQINRLLSHGRQAMVDVVCPAGEALDTPLMLVAVIEYAEAGPTASSPGPLKLYDGAHITEVARKDVEKLEANLGQMLPAYMVPAVFLLALSIPVNASGKLDRRVVRDQLRLMSRESLSSVSCPAGSKQAPTTAIEQRLQNLWATALVLDPKSFGINDSFFRLGGDSVVAMKLTAAARAEKIPLSVADIFQWPCLGDMAAAIEEKQFDDTGPADKDPAPLSLWPELIHTDNPEVERVRLLTDVAAYCSIAIDDIEDVYPCSPLQAGLMSITTQRAEAYVVQRVFSLETDLSIQKLKTAWARLVEALPILRTRIIPSAYTDALQVVVREQPTWQNWMSLQEYLEADKTKPITYGGALSRAAILVDADCGYFVWTAHHSVFDGWSLMEMSKLVEQLLEDEASSPSVPVSRFIAYLARQDKEQAAAFWQRQLEGASWAQYPALPSPQHVVNPRDVIQQQVKIPNSPGNGTMATLLRAAWGLLVAANTGSDESVISVVLSGRGAAVEGITGLVAPTITSVPFRVSASPTQSVREFLTTIHKRATEMIPYEHTGLQNIRRMVSSLGPEFDPGHSFVVQPAEKSESALPMRDQTEISADAFDAYSLTVECTMAAETNAVRVELRYDREVLPVDNAHRLLAQFDHIVHQLAQNAEAERPLGQLQLLSREDGVQLSRWNSTVPPRVERCVHDLVLDKMAVQPSAVAVSAWDGEITYKELDDYSRLLGYHLVERGVGPEIMVGMCMDKSKFGVVAMLAILRAGGAVVPFGVQHPVARIEGIFKDTATRLILVDRRQEQRLGALDTQLLAVDSFFCVAPATPIPSGEPCRSVRPKNVAWVIYTSGSTGMPKGVVLEHRALTTSILAHGRAFGIQSDDRLSQFAAYTFDVAIQEIMTSLAFGACVCIPSEDDRVNRLMPFLSDANVTIATLTSTVASLVQPENTPSVRTLVLMGEAVQPKVVDQWFDHADIINAYGPSECCIHTTGNKIQKRSEAPNVGKPLAGVFWVVNPANIGQLVPIGAPGELLIEGPQLARGYLNDPVKSAAAFINNPAFTDYLGLNGRRMYRTGDLVQQNADGSVIYLGRRDTQVKIRGQRVEIGEIESQIMHLLPDASEAIVDVLRPAGEAHDGVLMLVAVIEYPEAGSSSSGELDLYDDSHITNAARNSLQGLDIELGQVLPAYMIPMAYLLTPKIPVNNSGKLGRQFVREQLRRMSREALGSYSTMAKQAPKTAMEQKLHRLWAAALLLSPDVVGINDSFFRLGGDSVVAMKLTAVARDEQIPLSVADIFRWPRLVSLAAAIENKNEDYGFEDKDPAPFSLWPELAQTDPEKDDKRERLLADVAMQCSVITDLIEDIYPCSPLQAGLMAITAQYPKAYVAQRVFRLQANLATQQLKAAWTQLAENLPILRTHVIPSVLCNALQIVLRKEPVWHHGASLDDYLATDRANPITYGGALSRTGIVHNGADRYFIWTTHHSVYDGWSVTKIMELLARLLQGAAPPVPVPVSRFIAYLTLQNEEKTASFWQKHLKDANWARYPALPSSKHYVNPRDTLQQHLHVSLKSEVATLPIVLRAAWALLVATNTGLDEAVINVVLSGRMAPINGITQLIAPTITTVPFHTSVSQEQSVKDFLTDMQNRSTEMIPYEHTGLQNIYRMVPGLGPEFDPGHIFVVQPAGETESGTPMFNMGMDVYDEATSMDAFHAYPLTVECTVGPDVSDVTVELRYDRDVVPVNAAQRLLAQLSHIVQQLSDNTETQQPLGRLQLLSSEDSMQLSKWNSTVPPRVERCIHDLVLDEMAAHPERTAISAWDGELTYGELNEASGRLAHHLSAGCGVGPEVMVGLCMDKSKLGVVAMLAILRAGGAVVPLGVQHQLPRIQGIVQDISAPLVLVDRMHERRLDALSAYTQLLAVDSFFDTAPLSPIPTANPYISVQPDNVAWVIFTSGSTGTPKGVVLEHGALATSILAHGRAFDIQPRDRLSQFAAYTFDVAIQEIITTLCLGACICVPSEDDRVNRLTPFLSEAGITIATLTSTVAALIQPQNIPTIRTLVLMGEAVEPKVVDQWVEHANIINAYGPSECCIHTTGNKIWNRSAALNVGKPLASTFWVVYPASIQLVPIGAPGELLIEGPQLARGYLNDLIKTAASFIKDPAFVGEMGLNPGRRMYRTGDLVQQNPDRSLTYLGRRDTQVKIRGQRVEIGEIESQIMRLLPNAREAIVDLVPPAGEPCDGILMLVAVVEYPDVGPSSSGEMELYNPAKITEAARKALKRLEADLGRVLPAYMVPAVFLLAPKIPINTSGKLDRRAVRDQLRLMSRESLSSVSCSLGSKQAPTTTEEERLQRLWATALVLEPEAVGVNDSFFRLGGDSVIAMKLAAAARAEKIPLSVADIFRWPCLADMAAALEAKHGLENGYANSEDPAPLSLWPELAQADDADAETRLLADAAAQCNVSIDQIEDIYPCSPLQAGLMAITAQRPEAYVIQRIFRLQTNLSTKQLKAAWIRLVECLPILRTRIIPSVQADALQVVVRSQSQPVWQDWKSLEEYLAMDKATPITYGGVLSRTAIVANEDRANRFFVWTTHHSVYDGWSVAKTIELLARLLKGEAPPVTVPVSRFVRYLALQDKEEIETFWRGQLEGVNWARYPALLSPRNNVNPRHALQQHLCVPLTPATAIPTVLRAAWALLVATNTGLDEAVINVVLSGRMAPIDGITDVIAPTITTVPFYVSACQAQSVKGFLADIYNRAAEMIPYEHTGLQNIRQLVPGLGPEFDPGHIFVVQPAGEEESASAMLDMDIERENTSMDAFDAYALTVECTIGQGTNVHIDIRYDRAVLPSDDAQRLLVQFSHIVQQLAQNAETERSLGQLQLLSVEDSAQLCKWNSTLPSQVDRCIHDLVHDKMVEQPFATAISAWDGEMTYHELDTASWQLAHYLLQHNIGPEVMVGMCMDKSRLGVVAILAILRAGGAVVPLGVQHPIARIEGIVKDTAAPIVLVDRAHQRRLVALAAHTQLLAVDSFFDAASSTPVITTSAEPCRSVRPNHVSWVIYTSGSTGMPKGVVLEHGALATSILAHGRAFGIQPHDRLSQFAAYTFDVAIQEIMTSLAMGACICIPSEHDRMNRLTQFLSEANITIATLTSTVAALIRPQDTSVQTLVLMGEAVQPRVIDQWVGHATIINAYGPSECCIHTTGNKIRDRSEANNIGLPLASIFWVVNPASIGQLVSRGTPGELLIEGPQLARGYLNDPVKTAASFTQDPLFVGALGLSPGRRMYRTGDIVQQNANGSLTYLGRHDTQVKIRGQRVEVGEIEYHIGKQAVIHDAVVLYMRQGPFASQLIAAVILSETETESSAASRHQNSGVKYIPEDKKESAQILLRNAQRDLAQQVMHYMVPSIWIPLAAVPINASGKTDRLALTRWVQSLPQDEIVALTGSTEETEDADKLMATATPVERSLRVIWSEVLGIPLQDVTFLTTFFSLGGDSITAMQVVSASRARGILITVRNILDSQTIPSLAAQAQRVEAAADTKTHSVNSTQIPTEELAATATGFPLAHLSDSDMLVIEGQYLNSIGLSSITEIEDILSCSPIQQGILLTQMQSPSTYCIQHTCRIKSSDPANQPVSVDRLIGAWRQVVMRHSILRTVLLEPLPGKERFIQIVLRQPNIGILSENGVADAAVAEWFDSQPTLDVSDLRHPPHRLTLLRTAIGEVYCRLDVSHALVDASSLTLIIRDLITAYEEFLEKRQPQEDLQFWKESLSHAEPCLLPPQEPLHNSKEGKLEKVFIHIEDLTTLFRFRDTYGVSIASICQLAWTLVLASQIGSQNISFGTLTSGRDAPIPGVEELVGPMINMLVCHTQLDWTARVSDIARRLQCQVTEAFEHQRTSLASIQHELGFSRGQPLFNSTLSYKRQSLASSGQSAIIIEGLTWEDPTEYDLNVNIDAAPTELEIDIQYSTAAFSDAAATKLAQQMVRAVYAVCENAGKPLSQLSLLSPDDGERFCGWNSSMPTRLDRCVHDLILDKMAVQPATLAISAWDGEMTYGEVDEASRRLAYHLVEEHGVGPDVMVGLCMDKSKLGAVAMVAILRAGGAVVPLGVQQPLARIEGIMQDAAMPLVLVNQVHEQRLAPLRAHAQFLAIDAFFEAPPSALTITSLEPLTVVRPENVAWVIYTSGSTGKPKGVVLQHGSLATSILFHGRRLDIQSHDRLLQFAAFTFDAAIQEIITTFAFGACTCLPSEEDRMNRLTAYISEAKVTIATLTSTVAALVRPQDAPTVRTMILMGEAVQAKVVDQWIGHANVINAYGPSECCIHSTCQKIPDTSLALNIGTAIASGTWVVNPASIGQLVPLGAPGELLIEGPLLARGYLNDPVKTDAAFIEDPAFVEELGLSPGRRMYRTGDLVQQNLNGSLTYLGRIDTQVKIRGQRVEVGEIEYHIGKKAGIHDAVVLYMRQGALSGQLIAAVILSETETETSAASRHQNSGVKYIPEDKKESAQILLRNAQRDLAQQVMHYMVPRIWIPLAAAPINASGKTDRMVLTRWVQSLPPDEIPALAGTEETEDDDLPATATAVERSLREIWSEVLGVPLRNITYSAKFFSLGGDSITAMQVVSASRARGILITVRKVLECQTIPKQAAQSQTRKDTGDVSRVPEGAFALSPIQQMYFDQIAPYGLRTEGEYHFNQGVSLHITKRVELPDLAWALDEAVVKHAMLRARFRHSQDHGWQQWIERELPGSYRLSSHTAADAKSIQQIVVQSQGSLNLEHGPVFAAALIELQDRQVLHLVAHHLVIDLVSWRILIRDLEELLRRRKLPNPGSLSFPVWLERQNQSLSNFVSDIGTPAEAFVANTLPAAMPAANWEYWDLTPGQNVWGSLASIETKIESTTTSLLYNSANAALNTEPVEILLAALFLSFREIFTDRPVPAVFTEGHGREAADDQTDLSDTIGWFTTMTPLHVPVEANSHGSIDVLRQVKDQRRRIPSRGVPYFGSRFLTARGREAFAGHGPAEILFNYTGRFQQTEREDTLFRIDDGEYSTSDVGGMVKTFAVLDVTVTVEADELRISLRFSRQLRQQAAVRKWLQAYGNAVKSLVGELVIAAPTATATDFPLASLSDTDMGVIEGQYLNTMGLSSTAYIEDILPCSPIQQGILLTQVQSPSTYCVQQTCHIKPSDPANPVSIERLVRAWHHVVSRHSILRTILLEPLPGQERFIQVVLKQPDISILSEVTNIADGDVAEWFDSRPILDLSDLHHPPHCLTVLRTASGEVYCRLDVSHTLVDASSLTLIIGHLISAYEGALPAGGSYYSAYVAFLEGRQPQDDLQFWKTLLSDAQPCLLQPQEPPHNTEHEQTKLGKAFTQIEDLTVLHHFRDTYSISIASICHLAWALVLATRTGSNNISFGNLSSGRDASIPGVKEIVGPMINMLICHLQLDWDTTVSDIASKLQSQSAEAFDHQRTSLASIQHELGFSRMLPLFNSTLSYKRQTLASPEQASIILEGLAWEDPTEYDLNVNINATPSKLEIDLQYSTAVFSDAAARKLIQGLAQAIHAVCENGNQPLRQLSLLSSQDKAQFSTWNSIMPPRVERCLHELVLEKITTQPAAPAVCAWDGELTYGELDNASHRLAHHLAGRGVGPETKVGVCMDKSKWTIVAMLAILRAGGAVVPLGVQHPVARITGIVQDIAAPLVLVDRRQEQRLHELSVHTKLLAVNSFFESPPSTPTPSGEPCTSVRPENVAWVIFTSGSTGKPKGVVLEHRGLVTSILAHAPLWGLSPSTR
ncbi:hypothetical protein VN97_g10506, partial [Penicillium thymicola]